MWRLEVYPERQQQVTIWKLGTQAGVKVQPEVWQFTENLDAAREYIKRNK